MRPLVIIDGAHLKGRYLGTNLVVAGMDGNNQIVPIATGVCQGETGEAWTWFLSKLRECIGERPGLSIISDRHYAIGQACSTVFPNSFHGYCCRHLMMNCRLNGSKKLKGKFWKACKAYTQEEFHLALSDIQRVRPAAFDKLYEAGFEKWSRAYCPGNRYNYMTSNSAESINALTRDVRRVTITTLMEWYRELLQRWYCEKRYKYSGNAHFLKKHCFKNSLNELIITNLLPILILFHFIIYFQMQPMVKLVIGLLQKYGTEFSRVLTGMCLVFNSLYYTW